jgi:hypothetical protein
MASNEEWILSARRPFWCNGKPKRKKSQKLENESWKIPMFLVDDPFFSPFPPKKKRNIVRRAAAALKKRVTVSNSIRTMPCAFRKCVHHTAGQKRIEIYCSTSRGVHASANDAGVRNIVTTQLEEHLMVSGNVGISDYIKKHMWNICIPNTTAVSMRTRSVGTMKYGLISTL